MISVIVPVYNCERNLDRCVKSILAQSEKDLEVILVDDGSTDGSGSVCDKFAKENSNIKVIHQENGGVSKARNTGITQAKGKYIQFVDSDDYLEPEICKTMKEIMEKDDSYLVIAGFHHWYLGKDVIKCLSEKLTSPIEMKTFGSVFLEVYEQGFLNMPWNKLYKREKIKEYFPENLSLGEDLLFNLNYLKQLTSSETISFAITPLYNYIQERGKTNLSSKKRADKLQIAKIICQTTEDFYHKTLKMNGKEEIIHSRMISEFLCDLTEAVYDKNTTYQTFRQIADQYISDTYTKAINKNITNLPPDLNLLNKFFKKGNIRILWYLCHLRKLFLSLL